MQVAERRKELGLRVVVVSFAPPELLRLYERELALGVEYMCDAERAAYDAFGFGRASFARVWLDPRVWSSYAKLILRGRRPRPAQQDTLQLGGDVLVDAGGRIAWVYRSEGPEDRPSLAEVRRRAAALTERRGRADA